MNKEFLEKIMWKGVYILKPGTTSTFTWAPFALVDALEREEKKAATTALIERNRREGRQMLLPFRICFIHEDAAPVANTGRGAKKKVGQMKSHFTRVEESPYKIAKPFKACTSVWQVEGSRCFFYGTLGINLQEGVKPTDNGDLVIFYTAGWKEVEIYIFKGLAKPNEIANLQEVVAYVESIATKG